MRQAFESGAYATALPNGKEACVDWNLGICKPGNWNTCGKSHMCPKVLADGSICGHSHRAFFCDRE